MTKRLNQYIRILIRRETEGIDQISQVVQWFIFAMVLLGLFGVGVAFKYALTSDPVQYDLMKQGLIIMKWILFLLLLNRIFQIGFDWVKRRYTHSLEKAFRSEASIVKQ